MGRPYASRFSEWLRGWRNPVRHGQLDSAELETIVAGIVQRWDGERKRLVVEVGTGGGEGSTIAIERALAATDRPFQLIGYEGAAELARLASRHWRDAPHVHVVNEYFMHRNDLDVEVRPRVAEADRATYLPEFEAIAAKENFLSTTPPGPIDLLFIDSVRYTHLAILRAAAPWLRPETVVLMEDDIPASGELAIIESELQLQDIVRHELAGHQWPLVEFRIGPSGR